MHAVDIEKGSVLEVDDWGSAPPKLYWLLDNIFIPLTHIDMHSYEGLEDTYVSDGGGRMRMPYSKIDDKLQRGEMRVILDPEKARRLTRQFQDLRSALYKHYVKKGLLGRDMPSTKFSHEVAGVRFRRRHPVSIDLEALKVTLNETPT